ncbi:endosome-associated-trafficking regulator 1 [Gracilinanus agilis]|uniref:endosome-associated-trafficking regulator 1 n=1 Tax=Gracilinanus agilis TaxID=191870 RepID=UPI001CFCCB50|nr:endosome-associated-trafficking regulator 1 [Gracilinanus agilis]XP_044517203.1 endosome-associated-trafficking regulator 1 [Gracilinanus agilis]
MSGYTRRTGLTPLSRARTLVIQDDDNLEDLDEANPFSFKEFLKTKNLGLSKEEATNARIYSKESTRHTLGLENNCLTSKYSLDYEEPFFQDPSGAGDLLEEDEDDDNWSGTYLPSAMEQTHASRLATSTSPRSSYISFFSNPSDLSGIESLAPWTLSESDPCVSPSSQVNNTNKEFAAHGEFLGDRHFRSMQINYEALKEENSKLRRKISEIQNFSESQTEMVRTLERKLEAKMIKEESDYHDLESVVQQVEKNLELMTKRAVKAENQVTKLKQEINMLQAQLTNHKRENEALRSGQCSNLTVVKQNTDVALQNLRAVMNNAHSSIKQLLSGAETLNLVAEILKSIDRISEIKEEP